MAPMGCTFSERNRSSAAIFPTLSNSGSSFHIKGLDFAANNPRQNRFPDIDDFLRRPPGHGPVADHMGIDMAATGALDGVGLQILSDEKGLHLA